MGKRFFDTKIAFKFPAADIAEVCNLLNEFLKHISIVTLSRIEAEEADPKNRFIGPRNSRYCGIVKVINRWGIRDVKGKYYELLNGVVGRISTCCPMLIIYKPIELLLFSKLLDQWWRGVKAEFTQEEIEVFFLQPHEMIVSTSLLESGVHLYDLIVRSQELSLKSKDSKEFLDQGVARRLFMLKENVNSISKIYCESRIEPLSDNEKAILSLNINFFYANIYAILDCLAFVFAFEDNGYEIDRGDKKAMKKVGLFKKDFFIKINGLSEKLNLTKIKPWYVEIENLRHPVAHRIPLYFPEIYNDTDYCKIKDEQEKYSKNIKATLGNMTSTTNDISAQLGKLREERQKTESYINVFSGCFLHSFEESEKLYHLSRLTLDLGILYYLLDKSFEYLCEICG
jgi:hypothetical protein